MSLKNVTLEISLKPFGDPSDEAVRGVCRHLFEQWAPLVREADMVSVMLWAADGSEILDYAGDLDAPFEWARYIGHANPPHIIANDPDGVALHSRHYLYMENPPTLTYGWLKGLNGIIKEVGGQVTGKPVRVGATFDPGPEFAVSPFKYERHPEVCMAATMGKASFVGCYATLHADDRAYAGYPDGIPEGTPFGAFLGRQSQHFLGDLGFDYIWLSNGFGFGLETWGYRGPLFDGEGFAADRAHEIREKNLAFWNLFREECPDFPIETRGTNLSTAMDLSSDAVPLREIYEGGYDMAPPPNSPWAALNGDFGLELIGWMSHIAEIPGEEFPFRFYTHDPWWLNSPWLDRYGREPHDIYLPLAVSRIDATGTVRTPTAIEFLSVDDSYGRIPDQVPEETIPHIRSGWRDAPDAAGPLVWVYPFDEYHDLTFGDEPRLAEVFYGDWFMRGAVNQGLPLNTVVSTRAFAEAWKANAEAFGESILVAPTAVFEGAAREGLEAFLKGGGRMMVYGPIEHLDAAALELLNLKLVDPAEGEFEIAVEAEADMLTQAVYPTRMRHDALASGGALRGVVADAADATTRVEATATADDGTKRVLALSRRAVDWNGGALVWVRGSNPFHFKSGGHHPGRLDATRYYPTDNLPRLLLSCFGLDIRFAMRGPDLANPMMFEQGTEEGANPILVEPRGRTTREPLTVIARHANGFFFSGYVPETTATLRLRMPQGAPVLLGYETRLEDGYATYCMPRAWHRECRVFVEQPTDGELSCVENHSGELGISRRIRVLGLHNATVRFYPETGTAAEVKMLQHPRQPYLVGDFLKPEEKRDAMGHYLEVSGVTGSLLISW